jgi:hypothetical protein
MKYNYDFNRSEDEEYTGQYVESITTSIRGENPPLDAVLSGIETFTIACGFSLNGSGIGLVSNPE